MSIIAVLPPQVESDILTSVQAYHSDSVRRSKSDVASEGPFASLPCSISLDLTKAAMMSGYAMRQMADCFIADQLASRFRTETSGGEVKEAGESQGSAFGIPHHPLDDGTGQTDQKAQTPSSKFLQAYDHRIQEMRNGVKEFIVSDIIDNDNVKSLDLAQDTFFDTLVSASSAVRDHTIAWETARLAFMHSWTPRELLKQEALQRTVYNLKEELGIILGAWPDLPEQLNDAAKTMTMNLLAGKSGTA